MRKYLFRIIILIIIVLGMIGYYKFAFTYSEGYRAGLLQKFSYKGTLFKTYEGEMILSSVQSSANVAIASEKFLFSVTDEKMAKQIEKMQGDNIVVHYKQKNATLPWRGETPYIVDSVQVKRENEEPGGFR
jgi:hypothetical protein